MEGKLVSSRFKRVCVFCGSSTGKRNCYRDAAIELAQELVLDLFHNDPWNWVLSASVTDFALIFSFVCNSLWHVFGDNVKVSRRLELVYGGGSIGLMGLVSQAVHRGGGKVLGYVQLRTKLCHLLKMYRIFFCLFFSFHMAFTIFSFGFCSQDHPQDSNV